MGTGQFFSQCISAGAGGVRVLAARLFVPGRAAPAEHVSCNLRLTPALMTGRPPSGRISTLSRWILTARSSLKTFGAWIRR